MGGGNGGASRLRKRVEAVSDSTHSTSSIKRAKDGSAFARCEECNKDVPVALISFHNCSLDAKIKMNLEAQVVETVTEIKKKPAEKRKRSTESKPTSAKKSKDPNAPKRPPTAFFVFMEDFRKTYKEANPDCKSVATVAKEGGLKWKSLTEEEKKPYVEKAAELKAEYEKAVEDHNDGDNDEDGGDSSEKEEKEVEEILDDEDA